MNTKTALTDFSQNQFSKIDTGMINSHLFLCTAGIGLDAKVSHDFAKEKKRGFLTYSIVALKCFAKATSHTWKLAIDGEKIETEGLLLTIANANQYGNNVFIAPKALIQDGLFDVCVLKKFSFQHIPFIVKDIFNKTLHQNRFYTLIKGKEIKIENSRKIEVHYDGEPILLEGEIHIKMYPQSLKVFAN